MSAFLVGKCRRSLKVSRMWVNIFIAHVFACFVVRFELCFLLKDVIEGATAKQGLRVIHNAASQRDLFGPQSNSNAITSDHSHPFEGFISTTQFTSTIKQEPMDVDKENELENPKPTTFVDEGIDFDAVLTNGKIFGKVQCDRTKFRRWRMSEPLAVNYFNVVITTVC